MIKKVDGINSESDPYYYSVDAENDRIYLAEDKDDLADGDMYITYSLSENKLTMTILDGDSVNVNDGLEEYGIESPWEFNKK